MCIASFSILLRPVKAGMHEPSMSTDWVTRQPSNESCERERLFGHLHLFVIAKYYILFAIFYNVELLRCRLPKKLLQPTLTVDSVCWHCRLVCLGPYSYWTLLHLQRRPRKYSVSSYPMSQLAPVSPTERSSLMSNQHCLLNCTLLLLMIAWLECWRIISRLIDRLLDIRDFTV